VAGGQARASLLCVLEAPLLPPRYPWQRGLGARGPARLPNPSPLQLAEARRPRRLRVPTGPRRPHGGGRGASGAGSRLLTPSPARCAGSRCWAWDRGAGPAAKAWRPGLRGVGAAPARASPRAAVLSGRGRVGSCARRLSALSAPRVPARASCRPPAARPAPRRAAQPSALRGCDPETRRRSPAPPHSRVTGRH
jgi:hypothetical protein